jgi:hypothetical protein
MGYDLHIVRGPNYYENPDHQISADEWLWYVEADSELMLSLLHGPYFTIWSGKSKYQNPWLDWHRGSIYTKNPDAGIITKMLQIAKCLKAQVRGDDGEIYISPIEYYHDNQ